jgi:hypothetical protein
MHCLCDERGNEGFDHNNRHIFKNTIFNARILAEKPIDKYLGRVSKGDFG